MGAPWRVTRTSGPVRDEAWDADGAVSRSSTRPDRFDYLGAAVCLAGVGLIMYAPR